MNRMCSALMTAQTLREMWITNFCFAILGHVNSEIDVAKAYSKSLFVLLEACPLGGFLRDTLQRKVCKLSPLKTFSGSML